MTEIETKANAIIAELSTQRNSAGDRCALLAAELAMAKVEIESLRRQVAPVQVADQTATSQTEMGPVEETAAGSGQGS